MNSETEQKSALHKQKWEKDVGYEYTLKDWKPSANVTESSRQYYTYIWLIYDLYTQYMTCVLYTTEVTPDQTHDFTQTDPIHWFWRCSPFSCFWNHIYKHMSEISILRDVYMIKEIDYDEKKLTAAKKK